MASDERARTVLHEVLDGTVGSEAADTLMGYLPPVGWADVATKGDLDALAVITRKDLEHTASLLSAELHTEIGAVRQEMAGEFAAVRQEMAAEFARVDKRFAEIDKRFATEGMRLERSLRQMTMWMSGAVIASTSLAVAVTQALS